MQVKKCVIRLLTPIGMRYDETYARAYPFDKLVDDLFKPKMVEEAVTSGSEYFGPGCRGLSHYQ